MDESDDEEDIEDIDDVNGGRKSTSEVCKAQALKLFHAIINVEEKKVERILAHTPDAVLAADRDQWTAVHYGLWSIARCAGLTSSTAKPADIGTLLTAQRILHAHLLATGGSLALTSANASGVSVLHLGAWYGFDDIVDAALRAGSSVNGRANDKYMTQWMHTRLSGKTLFPRDSDVYRPDLFFSGDDVTPLYLAARSGHEGVVRRLVAAGAEVNASKSMLLLGELYDGVTALHAAAARGHVGVVRVLIDDSRCRVNARTTDGTTPLHCAVEGSHLAVVRALLDHRPVVQKQRQSPGQQIIAAPTSYHAHKSRPLTSPAVLHPTAKQSPDRLQIDNENVANVNAGKKNAGTNFMTPLHLAASFDCEEIARELIHAGADVNARTSSGLTPLHLASQSGARTVVTLLITAGAETEALAEFDNCTGLTPLLLAARVGRSDVVEQLIRFGQVNIGATCSAFGVKKVGIVHLAAVYDHGDTVREAVKLGADVNATTANGSTAVQLAVAERCEEAVVALVEAGCRIPLRDRVGLLHFAVAQNAKRITRALVAAGCDVNEISTTDDGAAVTPLCLAVETRLVDMVETLIDIGCDVDRQLSASDDGVTALHSAAERGSTEIARLLIDAGADVNKMATYGDLSRVTPIHLAITHGHAEMVDLLGRRGANVDIAAVDCSDNSGNCFSPLYLAVKSHNAPAVCSLIQNGCNVASPSRPDGWTPLHAACEDGDTDIVRALLDAGSDVNAAASFNDSRGVLALHQAAQEGHADIVDLLVSVGGCDVNARKSWRDETGISALHLAAEASHVQVVLRLIALGADVNAAKSTGWTALHWATRNGSLKIAEALLLGGATIDSELVGSGSDNATPVDLAADSGHTDLVKLLIDAGANYCRKNDLNHLTTLHRAAINGHVDIVRLLSCGRPELVTAVDRDGYTALHYAARGGHIDAVRVLIARQSPLQASNHAAVRPQKNGTGGVVTMPDMLPIHLAAIDGHATVCRFLVAAGCPVDAPTDHAFVGMPLRSRSTPLMISAVHGHASCVSALVELGADVHAVDSEGLTALHLASSCRSMEPDVIDILLRAGSDPDSGLGIRPIHLAVVHGSTATVRALLKAGCDVNALTTSKVKGSVGWQMTALHLAVDRKRHDVVRLLARHPGTDTTIKSANGLTAYAMAEKDGQMDICRTLKKRVF